MVRRHDDATSSELRHDWLADRWVIIAPQRTERPQDFERRDIVASDSAACPFCIGRESQTPKAVASYVSKNSANAWDVRVVPNKFPAVRTIQDVSSFSAGDKPSLLEADTVAPLINGSHRDASKGGVDLFHRRDLFGGHEVIVESPNHLQSISQLDRETTGLVFRAYRDRLAYWLNDREQAYAVLFKNVGQEAGASLFHTHSQLIATDIIPTDINRVTSRMRLFKKKESECLFCRMIDDELEQGLRVVEQTPEFVAFCPFASRLPSLITVVPRVHQSAFEMLSDGQLDELSWLTHRLVRRIEKCFPDAAYNFVIHTAPRSSEKPNADFAEVFHWRLELFPRLTTVAGFEWGSDCYINPLAPESAAESLRKAGV